MRRVFKIGTLIIGCVILFLLFRVVFYSFPTISDTVSVGYSSVLKCEIMYGEVSMDAFAGAAKEKAYNVFDTPAGVPSKSVNMTRNLVLCDKKMVYVVYHDNAQVRKMISEFADQKILWPGETSSNNSIILGFAETTW